MKTQALWSTLPSMPLDAPWEAIMDAARTHATGDSSWKEWKLTTLRSLLTVCQVLPYRVRLRNLDLQSEEALRLKLWFGCTVPLRPIGDGPLRVGDHAELGIVLPREIIETPVPGRFVVVLQPTDIFHPNIAPPPGDQMLCLSPLVPRGGFPLGVLLNFAYLALTFQEPPSLRDDAAGFMNKEAENWFEANPSALRPLTTEPFFREAGSPTPGGAG